MVVSSGARQSPAKASGSQSRWLCTRSNSADRRKACATCSASQTRPSRVRVLGVRPAGTRRPGRRGHRVAGGEQGDVDARAHQALGEQAGDLLPRPVVRAAGCARRSAPSSATFTAARRADRSRHRSRRRRLQTRPPPAPAGPGRTPGWTRRPRCSFEPVRRQSVVAAAGREVVDRHRRSRLRPRNHSKARTARSPYALSPVATNASVRASTRAAASSGCSSPSSESTGTGSSGCERQGLPTSRTPSVSQRRTARAYQSRASRPRRVNSAVAQPVTGRDQGLGEPGVVVGQRRPRTTASRRVRCSA